MSSTVGIDIGYETVKVLGLDHHGKRQRLRGMNIASIPVNSWQTDALLNVDEIAAAIVDSLKHAKPSPITSKRAVLALPESVIFSGTFSMPLLGDDELDQAIPFALSEKLSINLDDFYFDYEIANTKCKPFDPADAIRSAKPAAAKPEDKKAAVEPDENPSPEEDHGLTVFAVASKKSLIESVVELTKKLDLDLIAIDIKPGAIARAVIPVHDDKARAIIDLGAGSTGASIVEGHAIRVTSTVPWGVKDIVNQQLTALQLQKEFAPVFEELVHITKFFENRVCPGIRVEEVILSGSGANVASVAEIFQQETGLKTRVGEPFSQIDTRHHPISVQFSHTFSDSVGLAMRNS